MSEFLDIVDENGNPTGETVERSIAHRDGILHKSVSLWLLNKDNKVLLQKRSHLKKTNPNKWTASAAGHIEAGESVEDAIIKEAKEEINLNLQNEKIYKLFSERKYIEYTNAIENEIAEHFVYKTNFSLNKIKIQESEVSEVRLISMDEFEKEYKNFPENFCYYGDDFFLKVIHHLKEFIAKN